MVFLLHSFCMPALRVFLDNAILHVKISIIIITVYRKWEDKRISACAIEYTLFDFYLPKLLQKAHSHADRLYHSENERTPNVWLYAH